MNHSSSRAAASTPLSAVDESPGASSSPLSACASADESLPVEKMRPWSIESHPLAIHVTTKSEHATPSQWCHACQRRYGVAKARQRMRDTPRMTPVSAAMHATSDNVHT